MLHKEFYLLGASFHYFAPELALIKAQKKRNNISTEILLNNNSAPEEGGHLTTIPMAFSQATRTPGTDQPKIGYLGSLLGAPTESLLLLTSSYLYL